VEAVAMLMTVVVVVVVVNGCVENLITISN
jgi:hypothetical protein